jgi:hypothetical protein
MKNSPFSSEQPPSPLTLLIAYLIFGALHELAHLVMASCLLGPQAIIGKQLLGPNLILRILVGRCVAIPLPTSAAAAANVADLAITHSGWIFSVTIAILCHVLYQQQRLSPMIPLAAYITALEGMSTDLFGFIPHHSSQSWHTNSHSEQQQSNEYFYLTFFCGNFGILLLNSSWLTIDGGRTALDVLQKMVSVLTSFFNGCFSCFINKAQYF